MTGDFLGVKRISISRGNISKLRAPERTVAQTSYKEYIYIYKSSTCQWRGYLFLSIA